MGLNTKYLTPAEITGFVRGRVEQYTQNDALAQVLPDETVANISVRFRVDEAGITPEAEARDWDAQPGIVPMSKATRRTIDLVAFSSRIPVSESDALMARLGGDDGYAGLIRRAGDVCAQSIFNRAKRLRGVVLASGKATVNQVNFGLNEDFGRAAELNASLAKLASDTSADLLGQLADFAEVFEDKSGGIRPAYAFASTKIVSAFTRNAQFSAKLADGATRPTTLADVNAVLLDNDLPQLVRYNDKIGTERVLPEDRLILVPDYVNGDPGIGATVWGLTESSFKPEFSAIGGALPGAVAAVWDTEGTAGKTVVDADSTFLPILKNANLSASLKVI